MQKDFDDNADDSESDSTDGSDELNYIAEKELNYTYESDDTDPTVAGRVKKSKRKRALPRKFMSPVNPENKKGMFYVEHVFFFFCIGGFGNLVTCI